MMDVSGANGSLTDVKVSFKKLKMISNSNTALEVPESEDELESSVLVTG